MMKHYDVIISGAGIAGASLAARLGSHHIGKSKRILLLDTKKPSFNVSSDPKQLKKFLKIIFTILEF